MAIPSGVSPFILHTQAESWTYRPTLFQFLFPNRVSIRVTVCHRDSPERLHNCVIDGIHYRELGSAVPFRVSPLIFSTQAESGAYGTTFQFPLPNMVSIKTTMRHRASPERSHDCVSDGVHFGEAVGEILFSFATIIVLSVICL